MKILLVEDNVRLAERMKEKLEKDFIVDIVHTAEDSLEQAVKVDYSVIILDLGLPGMSGYDACIELRKLGITAPILVLSGLNAVATRIELLNAGADDYLTKPCDINELRARLYALKRRRTRHAPLPILHCGSLRIDTEKHLVFHNDTSVALRRKEFDILHYLMKNKGRIMTRQMIMSHAWNDTSSTWISTVDVHIKHLRDKIDRPFNSHYIKTAYGLGYTVNDD